MCDVARDELVALYFGLGFRQSEICFALIQTHGIMISERHLRRVLRRLHLYRRKHTSQLLDVALFIANELENSGKYHGYRWMHRICLNAGFVVSQQHVATILQILDYDGVESRRHGRLRRRHYFSAGPNHIWHVDSYDKIKRYGIHINGCIDGFSRKILWMKAGCSSTSSSIAGYFVNAVRDHGGYPTIIRGDKGSENMLMSYLMEFLTNNSNSFIFGRSVHNTRIESLWCQLRKQHPQTWIDTFAELEQNGLFTGSLTDVQLIQFVFVPIVQVLIN